MSPASAFSNCEAGTSTFLLTEDVRELQSEESNVVLGGQIQDVLGAHA